ncbi:CD209 antigen-like [Amphibalanus amphitrite]|uniref:CD209 antigen-like n=1 Tax=Amphibalanus amphitrite TaxID=1232801 RepID=UPI001C91FA4B|nr:CD209 antigen-like [Amphibalanus amphitrite]
MTTIASLAGEGRDLSVSAGPAPLTPSEGDPTGVMAAPLPHNSRSGWHSANDVCTDHLLTLKTEGELAKTAVLQRLSELQRAIGRVGDELGDLRHAVEQLAQSIITAVENGKEDILTELGYLRSDYTRLARTLELLQSGTDDSLRDISSRLDMLANAPQPRPSCPAGSTQRPDGQCYTCPALGVLHTDNNCYFLSAAPDPHRRAEERCSEGGLGHLATMTPANREFLYLLVGNQVNSDTAWIGLSRPMGSAEWVWNDGSPYGPFTDWPNGQEPAPSPFDQCVSARTFQTDRWFTSACTDRYPYICQVAATSTAAEP